MTWTFPSQEARDYADAVFAVLVAHSVTPAEGIWADIVLHDVARHYDAPGFLELVVDGSAREWRLVADRADPRLVRLNDHAAGPRGTPERLALRDAVNAALAAWQPAEVSR